MEPVEERLQQKNLKSSADCGANTDQPISSDINKAIYGRDDLTSWKRILVIIQAWTP